MRTSPLERGQGVGLSLEGVLQEVQRPSLSGLRYQLPDLRGSDLRKTSAESGAPEGLQSRVGPHIYLVSSRGGEANGTQSLNGFALPSVFPTET